MSADIWQIILIVLIVIFILWLIFRAISTKTSNNTPLLSKITKIIIEHVHYEQLLMTTYFTNNSNLSVVKALMVNNIKEIMRLINYCYPETSNLLEKCFMENVDYEFELAYKLFDSIQTKNLYYRQQIIQFIYKIFDNVLPNELTSLIIKYTDLYIASIESFLSSDYEKYEYQKQALQDLAIVIMLKLFEPCLNRKK